MCCTWPPPVDEQDWQKATVRHNRWTRVTPRTKISSTRPRATGNCARSAIIDPPMIFKNDNAANSRILKDPRRSRHKPSLLPGPLSHTARARPVAHHAARPACSLRRASQLSCAGTLDQAHRPISGAAPGESDSIITAQRGQRQREPCLLSRNSRRGRIYAEAFLSAFSTSAAAFTNRRTYLQARENDSPARLTAR